MLLKTGGGSGSAAHLGGIHWHIVLEGHIEFVATDDKLQEIPWVKMTDYVGQELVYRSDGRPHTDPPPEGELRLMDCMDCHNRSAHKFRAPADAVDIALREGDIDATLPYIKREAVAALVRPYVDAENARAGIATSISEFYHTKYPKVVTTHPAAIEQAISTIQDIYRHSFFSAMKVDWRTYPDSIGHKFFPGCFRCHDGRHVNQFGEKISHECHTCHTFLNPLEQNGETSLIHEGDFIHPMKLEGRHAELRCYRCHTGGVAPSPTCAGCHAKVTSFFGGTANAFKEFNITPDPMADIVECTGCHDLSKPTTVEAIAGACSDCHDDPEYGTRLAAWKKEIDGLTAKLEPTLDEEGRRRLQELREAGPLHNIEATRTILETLGGSAKRPSTSPTSQP